MERFHLSLWRQHAHWNFFRLHAQHEVHRTERLWPFLLIAVHIRHGRCHDASADVIVFAMLRQTFGQKIELVKCEPSKLLVRQAKIDTTDSPQVKNVY